MLLALDIRTTTTVLGLFTGPGSRSELVCRWRLHTDPLLTADEFALQLTGVLGEFAPRVTAVVALA
ncbi:MAG: pantothenate kinase, partial [Mycobacterium sp.]|nr:pantothenate kinase [Mycobacterium sp.]